jgi:peptide/nickel transport system ATP-binding protein
VAPAKAAAWPAAPFGPASPAPDSSSVTEAELSASVRPLVRVEDLHVTFIRGGRSVHALRGVSFELRPGEILGLVGESGSGKSVLGLALLGLLPSRPTPDVRGYASVCGTDMVEATAEKSRLVRKEHLGAVFQDPMTSLNPTMRIGRQVAEVAGTASEAIRLLDAVGVPDPGRRLRAFPHELSGGLRQRVMIAMAVAGSPSLVIADEPTTALDVTVQAQILELISTLRDELGTSFILVTHDLGVAAQVADRIAVLYGGRLAEVGPSTELFNAPLHPLCPGPAAVPPASRHRPGATGHHAPRRTAGPPRPPTRLCVRPTVRLPRAAVRCVGPLPRAGGRHADRFWPPGRLCPA